MPWQALLFGSLPGAFLALEDDALDELGGRFVVRVLRDELSSEGVPEDRLAQCLRSFELRIKVGFEMIDDGELVFDGFNDGFLLR